MFIEFADKETQEYTEGMKNHFLKENEPFEVSEKEGRRLIKKGAFKEVSGKTKAELRAEREKELLKKRKAELVAEAEARNLTVVPDEETIPQIVEKILVDQDAKGE